MGLNELRDEALRIAVEHGFTDASVGEDIALMHSELSEALEDHRAGKRPDEVWYETREQGGGVIGAAGGGGEPAHLALVTRHESVTVRRDARAGGKPCGIPSEMADVIIRVLHFCGKHGIDIEQAVREKMIYNESRPIKHGKVL